MVDVTGDGVVAAVAPCFCCKEPFLFDPETVISIAVDPVTGLSPDLGGDPQRAVKQPLCPGCLEYTAGVRQRRGLPPHVINR